MRPIIHRLIAVLTLVIFLIVQRPLPSQAAGVQARPATWTHCTVHLKLDLSGVQRYDCRTFAMPREHRTVIGHVSHQRVISPHVRDLVKWPLFYKHVSPPPAPTLDGFPPLVARWAGYIYSAARATGIDPRVIAGVIYVESSGIPTVSSQGFDSIDVGLMQYGLREAEIVGGAYTYDPAGNIMTGSKYLEYLSQRYAGGNIYTAVAMYNGGPGNPQYGYAARVFAWV